MGLFANSSRLFKSYVVLQLLQSVHMCAHAYPDYKSVLMQQVVCGSGLNRASSRTFWVSLPWRSCQGPRQGVKWCVGHFDCVSYCGQCKRYIGQQRSLCNIDMSSHAIHHTCSNASAYILLAEMCTHKSPKLNCIVQGPFAVILALLSL